MHLLDLPTLTSSCHGHAVDWVIPLMVVHCIRNSGIPLSLTADEDNVKDGLRFSCLHSRAMELMTAEEGLSG